MIGFLHGILLHKAPPQLLIEVQGVGYEVEAPMTTFYDLPIVGSEIRLHTHLVVREDAHVLFGFANESERALFRLLIKINGVGPKLALAILSGQSAEEFCRCIQNNDTQALVRLPGIGKKTAERLIIEMRDRLPETFKTSANAGVQSSGNAGMAITNATQEAIAALCALGYKPQDASRMIQSVASDDKSCEQMIRLALQGAGR